MGGHFLGVKGPSTQRAAVGEGPAGRFGLGHPGNREALSGRCRRIYRSKTDH